MGSWIVFGVPISCGACHNKDISLVAITSRFPLPSTNVHPCLGIPPLEIAELVERSHRYLNYILFFWPDDFYAVAALPPGSVSSCTNSSAHKMEGMMQGLGTKRQAVGWAQGMLKAAGASMPPKVLPQPKRAGKRKKKKKGRRQGGRSLWRESPPFLHLG